jgi:tripartite-type tricarboxylate transporter receptor subunit TctC
LSAEIVSIMGQPEMVERARTQGFRVDARGMREFAPFLKDEVERWGRVITAARIQPD